MIVPTTPLLSLAQGQPIDLLEDDHEHEHQHDQGYAHEAKQKQSRERKEQEEEAFKCPICLGKPVAGRMTKCGHVSVDPGRDSERGMIQSNRALGDVVLIFTLNSNFILVPAFNVNVDVNPQPPDGTIRSFVSPASSTISPCPTSLGRPSVRFAERRFKSFC